MLASAYLDGLASPLIEPLRRAILAREPDRRMTRSGLRGWLEMSREYWPRVRRAFEKAARLSGIRTERLAFLTFVNMGMLAALAGLVFAARLNTATPKAGRARAVVELE